MNNVKEIQLLSEIAKTRDSIRKKYMKLKNGIQDAEDNVNQILRPIIEPLGKISNSLTRDGKIHKGNLRHSTPVPYNLDDSIDNYETAFLQNSFSNKNNDQTNISNIANDEQSNNAKSYENQVELKDVDFHDDTTKPYLFEESKNHLNDSSLQKEIKTLITAVKKKDYKKKNIDTVFGVRSLVNGMKFGNASFSYDGSNFKIGDKMIQPTPGLKELLFKKDPNDNLVSSNDIDTYHLLVNKFNVLHKNFKPNTSFKNDKSKKFNIYLSQVIKGSGFFKKLNHNIDHVYWDDPNELVSRLRLLNAEKQAGNNNHENEIISIMEELREAQIIH